MKALILNNKVSKFPVPKMKGESISRPITPLIERLFSGGFKGIK